MEKFCKDNHLINFLIEPRFRIYRHLLVVIYIICNFIVSKDPATAGDPFDFYKNLCWNGYFIAMFYINMYVLIPRYLYKGKFLSYGFVLIALILSCYLLVQGITESYMSGYDIVEDKNYRFSFPQFFQTAHMITLMVGASTGLKLFQRWTIDNNKMNALEKNSLQFELRELKNQVNPHFLFNMLNNVNVLVHKDPDKASLIIMKLSDFLRLQLCGNNSQAVLFTSEMRFLTDFMELEKIRRDAFTFTIDLYDQTSDPDVLPTLMLQPNLFLPFVENALKHSVDPDHASNVAVAFTIDKEKITFTCENTKPDQPLLQQESGGLGLPNIKRRLQLLYGTDYDLQIEDLNYKYKVTLTLNL